MGQLCDAMTAMKAVVARCEGESGGGHWERGVCVCLSVHLCVCVSVCQGARAYMNNDSIYKTINMGTLYLYTAEQNERVDRCHSEKRAIHTPSSRFTSARSLRKHMRCMIHVKLGFAFKNLSIACSGL